MVCYSLKNYITHGIYMSCRVYVQALHHAKVFFPLKQHVIVTLSFGSNMMSHMSYNYLIMMSLRYLGASWVTIFFMV